MDKSGNTGIMKNPKNSASGNSKPMADRHAVVLPFIGPRFLSSPLRSVLVIALSVFFCEILEVYFITPLMLSVGWVGTYNDAAVMMLILCPLLYFFLYRPLAANIKERQLSEESLRESELRLRTVFDTSPDAITVSSLEDGRIFTFNEGFTALFGFTAEDVIGKSAFDANIWNDPKNREEMIAGLGKNGQVNNFESKFNRKDGHVITGLTSARVIKIDNEPRLLAVTRDITELKKASRKLNASNQFLQIANRHKEMAPLLNEFIAETKRLTDCAAVGIRIPDGQGNLPFKATVGCGERFCKSDNLLPVNAGKCMCKEIVRQPSGQKSSFFTESGSFYTDSTAHLLATVSEKEQQTMCYMCKNQEYESLALIPIRAEGKIHGLIFAADPRQNLLAPETVEILEGASMQLGTAIERVRAEEAVQKSHRELEKRVKDRTAKLVSANKLLNLEIEERILNEKKLREQQDKLRSLSSELLLTEERERRRIATELHDRIGQSLAITKIKLGELRESLPSKSTVAALDNIRQFIDQIIQDTRTLTFELSPPVLYELGLEAGLEWLISQIEEKHGIRIKFENGDLSTLYDDSCHVVIFQAARELLFNIVKHAGAQSAVLSIRKDEETIRLDISDDGVGFDTAKLSSSGAGSMGFGLFSIRERLSSLGGHLAIESEPGSGTRVTMVLPLSCKIKTLGN